MGFLNSSHQFLCKAFICGLSPHTVVKFDAGLLCDLEHMIGSIPENLALFIQCKQVVAQR